MSEPRDLKWPLPGLGAILAVIVLVLAIVFYTLGKLDATMALMLGLLAVARLT